MFGKEEKERDEREKKWVNVEDTFIIPCHSIGKSLPSASYKCLVEQDPKVEKINNLPHEWVDAFSLSISIHLNYLHNT